MTNEPPDRFDLILNAAIRDYSNAEPRPGLERRILRHVQTRSHRLPRWRFSWALVVAAIAVIVLIALPTRRISLPRLARLPPPVPLAARPVIPALLSPRRTAGRRSLRRSQETQPLPLTAEERALLRLVQEQPGLAEAALSQPAELEALTI
jgi:hypothetical protein